MRVPSGANPGACTRNDHSPVRKPMIEKRPLSSVVAVKLFGEAFGFSAVIDAPLIGCPRSSFTMPPTRPVWAAASLDSAIAIAMTAMAAKPDSR